MDKQDAARFKNLITLIGEMYEMSFSDSMVSTWWGMLRSYSIDEVETATRRYMATPEVGKFKPKPSEIIGMIQSASSNFWLSSAEAWATQPKDEQSSGAVCDEMMVAWGVAEDTYLSGDKYAARLAYCESYDRAAKLAISEGLSPKWWPTLGFDAEGRHAAEVAAVKANNLQLPPPERKALPPAPGQDVPLSETIARIPSKLSGDGRETSNEEAKRWTDQFRKSIQ